MVEGAELWVSSSLRQAMTWALVASRNSLGWTMPVKAMKSARSMR